MVIILVVQIVWCVCNTVTNMWLVEWTDSYAPDSPITYGPNFFIVGYVIFGFLYALIAWFRALLIAHSSPKMSNLIH